MNVVDAIGIALELKTEKLESGLKVAQNSVSTFAIAIGSALGSIFGGVLQELLQGIPRVFNAMKAEVKALDDINKKTNANVEDISAWGFAVEESGGSAKAFQQTLVHLYNDLSRVSITGRGRSKPFLEALGIDPKSVESKGVFEVISEISKAVQGMDEQKSGYILKNLGFDPDTIKFIQSEGKRIDEVIAKQKEWGIYTKKDTEAIDKMDKAVKRSTTALKTLFLPTFSKILTVMAKGAEYVSKAIIYLRKNSEMLRASFLLLAPAIVNLSKFFLATPIGKLVAGIASLVILFEDLWVYAKKGKTAFGDFWKHLGTPEEVMAGFESAGRTIKRFFTFLGSIFDEKNGSKTAKFFAMIVGGILALVAVIGAIPVAIAVAVALLIRYWEEIEKFFDDVVKNAKQVPDAIVEAFKIVGRMIASILMGIWGFVKSVFSSIKDTVVGAFETAKEFVVSAFETAKDTILGLWENIKSSFESGCSAISNWLSDAANTARSAWSGFITWLEEKWKWITDHLPDFLKAAESMPKAESAAKMASEGKGGSGGVTNNYDNKKVDVHTHTGESTERALKELNLTSMVESGLRK